ncbi:MAG: hypothetical protein ACFFDT_33215, partial [Candidatus Hodarchaeota archaeon]
MLKRNKDSVNILGISVSTWALPKICKYIETCVEDGGKHFICAATANSIVMAQKDPEFFNSLDFAHLVIPDSFLVLVAARFLHPSV